MAEKTTLQCRKISKITDTLLNEAIELYNDGEMVSFWDAVNALDVLTEVQSKVCYIEEK